MISPPSNRSVSSSAVLENRRTKSIFKRPSKYPENRPDKGHARSDVARSQAIKLAAGKSCYSLAAKRSIRRNVRVNGGWIAVGSTRATAIETDYRQRRGRIGGGAVRWEAAAVNLRYIFQPVLDVIRCCTRMVIGIGTVEDTENVSRRTMERWLKRGWNWRPVDVESIYDYLPGIKKASSSCGGR